MFSDLTDLENTASIQYPLTDNRLSFTDYISQCRNLIRQRRQDITDNPLTEQILEANSPFEFRPPTGKHKHGILLIHGLLDCPFTFQEIGTHLAESGILVRSILLPGHGTKPDDLKHVTYQDWVEVVKYGIDTLKNDAENIYIAGFSTGAALSIYHAMHDDTISGLILLSPAIKVRAPVDIIASVHHLANAFGKDRGWVYHCQENDYTKYKSIAYNGVKQVAKLTRAVRDRHAASKLKTPIYMILSREDETISSHDAIDFFTTQHHPKSKMLLYTSYDHHYPDKRIEPRISTNEKLHIAHLSHPSLPFSPRNSHYGEQGNYIHASRRSDKVTYGAYNRAEIALSDFLAKYRLIKTPRRVLTYNPDFDYMVHGIQSFILTPRP